MKKTTLFTLCFVAFVGFVSPLFGSADNNGDGEQQAQSDWSKLYIQQSPDKSNNAFKAANTDVIISNPTAWPVEVLYARNGHGFVKVVPQLGGQVNLGNSSTMMPIIGIKTLPATATKGSWWYGATSMLYKQDFTPFQLNTAFKNIKFGDDQYALVTLIGTQTTWNIKVTAEKKAERKTAIEVVDAFRMYAESHKSFNYAELFKASLMNNMASNFVLYNNSYWPIDVVYFKDGQAYKVSAEKGQTVPLSDGINRYIAINARPMTSALIAGLLGVEYNYHILDMRNFARSEWFDNKDELYQINVNGDPSSDWSLEFNTLTSMQDIKKIPAKAISIDWPKKLGRSKKSYVKYGQMLNNAILSGNEKQILPVYKLLQEIFPEQTLQQMVKALILYYHALAQQLGHVFEEGTFIIHDGAPIYKFLQSLKPYKRNSSHLNPLAAEPYKLEWLAQLGKNHFGYNVDMPEINFSTILFNRITEDGSIFYLKPESHGTAGLAEAIAHGISFIQAQGRKKLPGIFGSDDQAGYSKERIPKDILKRYMAIIEKIPAESEDNKNKLAQNAVSWGLRAMYASAKALLEKNEDNAELTAFVADLEKAQDTDIKRTYLDKRIGSEVILTPAEFKQEIMMLEKNNKQTSSSSSNEPSSSSSNNTSSSSANK